MDSAKSFFPTRADVPSRNLLRNKLYQICKQPNQTTYHTLEPHSTSNIFKQVDFDDMNKEIERPIGGQQLFKKMDLIAQERRTQGKRLRRTNRQYYQRNVYTSSSNNNHRLNRTSTDINEPNANDFKKVYKKYNKTETNQQLFKSHQIYKSQREIGEDKMKRGLAKSLQTIQPKFHSIRTIQKIDRQVEEYQDKMALLGEIDRQRPLVQLCGDSYFQMILRNRFEDDLKMPSFIYRIKEKMTESKAISRLKSYKPNILERKHLILRGRGKQQEEEKQ